VSIPSRPYFYGYARTGKTVHAYTRDEWGIGASSGGGRQYAIRSFYFSIALSVMFVVATLACTVLAVIAVLKPSAMFLAFLFFGLIFGLGVLQSYFNLTSEWQGRKLRKLKGLPKPWFTASDDRAYEWFKEHPSPQIPLTPEYFPESVQLQRSEPARRPS
jgi:hypothetical protein